MVVPLIFVFIFGLTIILVEGGISDKPFGFVDHSDSLDIFQLPDEDHKGEKVELRSYEDEEDARLALNAGEIQGYYVIPVEYPRTLEVNLYYAGERPNNRILIYFDEFVRANLINGAPTSMQKRIIEGIEPIVRSADRRREFREEAGFVAIIFPLLVTIFFLFAVMSSAGYFLQAITDEKENRTMEVMITSVSPAQLIVGKASALISVALTQLVIWMLTVLVGWIIARQLFEALQVVRIPWDILLVLVFYFLPTFTMIAGIMATIGAMVTELKEGQQVAGILNLLFTFPLFISAIAIADPDSPLLVFLTFFPTTAFITISMRWGFTTIPFWQLVISWVLVFLAAVLSVWAAARIFRLGMLRYGQRVSLKSAISALRNSRRELMT